LRCDRLIAQLVCDALAFELAAFDGSIALLPRQRPPEDLVVKRCRHGLRVIRPTLARMALDGRLVAVEPKDLARQACSVVRTNMSIAERHSLGLSMLPVYTAHDEYLFLRVLQTFETVFSLLAVYIRTAVRELGARQTDSAVRYLTESATALRESTSLFSMLATMQVESFRTFREFTEGASAIQSRNYKIVESLCRRPDADRIDSAAFTSVPEVRHRVVTGLTTLDDAFREARVSGELDATDRDRLTEAMHDFERMLRRWRNTHYRLAVRMLGSASGTGYTEGTPYLAAVRDIPVFQTLEHELEGAQ
jgi:tryptophan 2,3-dioxygenase